MHSQFESLLRSLTPAPQIIELATTMMKDLWDIESKNIKDVKIRLEIELRKIERSLEEYTVELRVAPNKAVKSAIYQAISKLDEERAGIEIRLLSIMPPPKAFDKALGEALSMISNPYSSWVDGNLERKQLIQKLVFPCRLPYVYSENFRKPELALPFAALGAFSELKGDMVEATGIEPATS